MSMHPHHRPGQPGPSGPQGPLPSQANPSWMGHVQPEYYRPVPGNAGGPVHSVVQPVAQGRQGPVAPPSRAGLLVLMIGGGALAFLSLFLVVPFLLANTGTAGFMVGFIASLLPLST